MDQPESRLGCRQTSPPPPKLPRFSPGFRMVSILLFKSNLIIHFELEEKYQRISLEHVINSLFNAAILLTNCPLAIVQPKLEKIPNKVQLYDPGKSGIIN